MADTKVGITIEAYDKASAQLAAVSASLKGIGDQNKAFQDQTKELQAVFTKMSIVGVAGFTAISAAIGVAVNNFSKTGDELLKMSQRTGIAVETLSQLKFAAEKDNVSIDDLEKSIKKMQVTMYDAAQAGSKSSDAFDEIGVSVLSLKNLSPDQQFIKLATALAGVDDNTKRTALAMQIFGREGTAILPILADGAQGLQQNMERAKALGVTFDSLSAEKSKRFQDSLNDLHGALTGLGNTIGNIFIGTLNKLVVWVTNVVQKIKDWTAAHPELTRVLVAAGLAITALIAVVGVLGATILGIGGSMIAFQASLVAIAGEAATLTTALYAIGTAIMTVMPYVAILAAGIAAGTYAFDKMTASAVKTRDANLSHAKAIDAATDSLNKFAKPIEADKAMLDSLTQSTKDAAKSVKDLLEQINQATQDLSLVAQEQNVANIKKDLGDAQVEYSRSLSSDETIDRRNELAQQVADLQNKLSIETAALASAYTQTTNLSLELTEARRRANETEFQRKMEDLAVQAKEENKQYALKIAHLKEQLVEQQNTLAEALAAEQKYTSDLNKQNQERIANLKKAQEDMRALLSNAPTLSALLPAMPIPSGGSSAFSSFGFGNSGSTQSFVHDAVITPDGDVIHTDPEDFLIATKNPSSLAGAGGITVNINGGTYLSQDAARILGDMILQQLKLQFKL